MEQLNTEERDPASFRDPSGYVFARSGEIFRFVSSQYKEHYEFVASTGLLAKLCESNLLIEHEDVSATENQAGAYKILRVKKVPFVSYPYEWSFSQLKDAALTTLQLQKIAMEHGATLKDCSAYNIQFLNGSPIMIDTLSFEKYQEEPWVGYRQFCEQFLAPLALMSYSDLRLGKLLQSFFEGVPLDLTMKLLPVRANLNFGIFSHIRFQSFLQEKSAGGESGAARRLNKKSLLALLENLGSTIESLKPGCTPSIWAAYLEQHNYTDAAMLKKQQLVDQFVARVKPETVWDIGANTGAFSKRTAEHGINTVAFDFDPICVELNYVNNSRHHSIPLLPLVADIASPSPGLGWAHRERRSLVERGPADLVLLLAVIHHLVITRNIPMSLVAEYLHQIANALVIELVQPADSQVKRLLAAKQGLTHQYGEEEFLRAFGRFFEIERREMIEESDRVLFLLVKRK